MTRSEHPVPLEEIDPVLTGQRQARFPSGERAGGLANLIAGAEAWADDYWHDYI